MTRARTPDEQRKLEQAFAQVKASLDAHEAHFRAIAEYHASANKMIFDALGGLNIALCHADAALYVENARARAILIQSVADQTKDSDRQGVVRGLELLAAILKSGEAPPAPEPPKPPSLRLIQGGKDRASGTAQ